MIEGMIRVAPLVPSRQVLARFGVDLNDVLDECGLGEELFADPDNAIAFGDVCRFARAGATASGCEHFGLLLAREAGYRPWEPSASRPSGIPRLARFWRR